MRRVYVVGLPVDTQGAAFATYDVLGVVERKAAEMTESTYGPPSVAGQEG
jgi:hypothetical protein